MSDERKNWTLHYWRILALRSGPRLDTIKAHMGYRWIVKCKRCSADITFKIVDEQPPRAAVDYSQTDDRPRPVMMRQALQCALCETIAEYMRQDLQFRSA